MESSSDMKILVIGSGGREHALAWKLAQSPRVARVFVAPGNAGTARERKCTNVPIGAEDIERLAQFAQSEGIGLTVVGPEAPLVAGIVDRFREAGLVCFGPTRRAARLEGSKYFTKEFCLRHAIPTAAYASFTEAEAALGYLETCAYPLVVKADGLAAGKGVIVAEDRAEAARAVEDMLARGVFGAAGRRIVIEEFLTGEEASFIVIADGERALALASAQDHKRALDGDRGPNTGGMGAYSPAPLVTPALHARILREVIEPTLRGMRAEGSPYLGFLYAGLMITPDGSPKLLEFNCRLGDPETQPILMRLKTDLLELMEAALAGRLDRAQAEWDPRAALAVVMAAGGYPGPYRQGDVIHGLPEADLPDVKVFHAGTAEREGEILTAGGRVLTITALGATVAAAARRAYEVASRIHWEGVHYRRDIGARAIAHEQSR
jgi:phosphoribosylamine--glycine ligase